jgi:predicted nucleic acid-binding protein
MSFLIDTNVISERLKAKPNDNVSKWFDDVPAEMQFISVLTLGEIRKGIEKLDHGKRKTNLLVWLEHDLPSWFGDHILPIDQKVSDYWGYLTAQIKRPLPVIDGLLAATAIVHQLKIVTRNVSDFTLPGLEVINPWDL